MKTKRLVVPCMLMLAMTICVCADPIHLTEADNGRTNSVDVGGEIEIVLKGNPTTGYSWETASFSTNRLQQIGTAEYLQSGQSGEKHRVGAGGKFVFRFKAVVSGQGCVKLIYRRSWETTASDKNYCVTFEIR